MQVSLNRAQGIVLVMDNSLLHSVVSVILTASTYEPGTREAETLVLCVREIARRG